MKMSFSSLEFLLFFPLVIVGYNLLPQRFRLLFLLLSSYVFYLFQHPAYAFILLGVTIVTFFFAKWINNRTDRKRKRMLAVGVCCILLPLLVFKYYNGFNQLIFSLFDRIGINVSFPSIDLLLPVGMSFYTFMAIGYLVDVYYDEVQPETNFCSVALFLSFFPYLLSGPIERSNNMFPQIRQLQRSKPNDISKGLKTMLWGYFMKLCVADRIKPLVDVAFENLDVCTGSILALVSALYAIELYADFGGYSLIAIGSARCLGINIIENFRRPFFATSISELWHRWHISLINWLTEYIFSPVSFSLKKLGGFGVAVAIIITFLISGLWHGAKMTFVIWGLINGIFLCYEMVTRKYRLSIESRFHLTRNPLYVFLRCFFVFVIFSLSTILCRCDSLAQGKVFMSSMFFSNWETDYILRFFTAVGRMKVFIMIIALIILITKECHDEFSSKRSVLFESHNSVIRFFSYFVTIVFILLFGVFSGGQYIYFNF